MSWGKMEKKLRHQIVYLSFSKIKEISKRNWNYTFTSAKDILKKEILKSAKVNRLSLLYVVIVNVMC